MISNPKQECFSEAEYLGLEKASDRRWEYWDGRIVCMSGGTPEHSLISSNVHDLLAVALEGSPCRPLGADVPIDAPKTSHRYADVSAVCGKPEFRIKEGIGLLSNPVLIVEVESPTTAAADHGPKFEDYKAVPTFREYLVIAQDKRRVTHWQKIDAEWISAEITDGLIRLSSVDCELKITDIYEGVEL